MLVDWFTVGAQLLNFLILVWLMKRFLYQPVLHAIDERERRIAAELADADARKAEALRRSEELQRKTADLDQRRDALLAQAVTQAQTERQRLLDEARAATTDWSNQRRDALRSQERDLRAEIRRRTQQEVWAVARKTLADLADSSLEDRLAETFLDRLGRLSDDAKRSLAEALQHGSDPALVRSAFELAPDRRAAIQRAVEQTVSGKVRLRFETVPELISGIELVANGQKLAWTVGDYLTSLASAADDLLVPAGAAKDAASGVEGA
ncbi:MAG: F0F1 ATP synthase subunit B [Acidobacteria bacterium]|nr:F0F1 ATP synthase subunit B [Acidobacteriota bacterium]